MSLRSGIILLALGLLFLAGGVMAFSHVMGPKGLNRGAFVLGMMSSAIGLGILFVFWLLLPPSANHPPHAYEYSLDRLPPILEGYADELLPLARPCVYLRAERVNEELPTMTSKYGGVPFLPASESWPIGPSGGPMTFIGQLNFGEIASALEEKGCELPPGLPREGILSFFDDLNSMSLLPPKHNDEEREVYRFFWSPTSDDRGAVPMPPEQEGAPIESRLVPQEGKSLPSAVDESQVLPDFSPKARRAYGDFLDWGFTRPAHQVLGYPRAIHMNPCEWAGLSASDEPQGRWRLLWQIDSDEDGPGFMWVDAGKLYILIAEEDLAARRFDRLLVDMQFY
jgi:uncharacterized protein YwqG